MGSLSTGRIDGVFCIQFDHNLKIRLSFSQVRMPQQVPYAIAMEILLTGKFITAEKALQYGFVNYVVPKDQVLPKALELAGFIVDNGPFAVRSIKKSVKECLGLPEKEALKKELEIGSPVFQHPDSVEGPTAFFQKRKPIWKSNL